MRGRNDKMNLIILEQEDFIDQETVRLKGRRLAHVTDVHRAEVEMF